MTRLPCNPEIEAGSAPRRSPAILAALVLSMGARILLPSLALRIITQALRRDFVVISSHLIGG